MNSLKKYHNFNYQCSVASPNYPKLLSLFKAKIKMTSALRSVIRERSEFSQKSSNPQNLAFLFKISPMQKQI